MKARLLSIGAAIALLVSLFGTTAFAQGPNLTPRIIPIPIHPVNAHYAEIKAAIDAHAPKGGHGGGGGGSGGGSCAGCPTIGATWLGLGPNGYSPSDATGAIGPSSYIEMINATVGVFSRTGSLLSSNSEATFTGNPNAGGDGQILWDPSTNRFYYAMLSISATNQYGLIYGFSKGSNPSASPSDWCTYASNFGVYGTDLPDYPKLGTTSDYILIGVNDFSGNTFVGADVAWSSKPQGTGTISTCPGLAAGVRQNLKNQDGSNASTPVVARQTDGSSTGYVVANEDPNDAPNNGSSTVLSVFTITAGPNGPTISPAQTVTVPAYSYPPSAPQPNTKDTLDTLDARLTNAWLAPDPNHGGAPAIWTQHAVAASGSGSLGAEVRWYEINPSTGSLFQSGVVGNSSLYVFDGAISPDRTASLSTTGGNMVLGFNTSSTSSYPALQMVSKKGSAAQSAFVMVSQSSKSDTEFTCTYQSPGICRWGDYAGASPDPSPSNGVGQAWLTGMLSNGGNFLTVAWKTWNWQATP